MPQSFTLRTRLRSSHLGAICIALLFWAGWQQVYFAVKPFIGGACLRLLNYFIHYSPGMLPVLRSYPTIWKSCVLDLWFGLLFGVAAVMIARWLYAPEQRA
jgi:hypothetical protein